MLEGPLFIPLDFIMNEKEIGTLDSMKEKNGAGQHHPRCPVPIFLFHGDISNYLLYFIFQL